METRDGLVKEKVPDRQIFEFLVPKRVPHNVADVIRIAEPGPVAIPTARTALSHLRSRPGHLTRCNSLPRHRSTADLSPDLCLELLAPTIVVAFVRSAPQRTA